MPDGAKQNFAERSNRMNRTYEIMFIVRPDVEEADLDKLIEGFSGNITSGGGEIKSGGRDFLLTPMRKQELAVLDEVLDRVRQAVEVILSKGASQAMNEFNRN